MEKYNYILFHLPLLQEIFKRPKNGFIDILDVGVYNVSTKLNTDMWNALTQVVYCYYNGELTESLENWFEQMEEDEVFFPDDEKRGFRRSGFVPHEELDAVYAYAKDYPELLDEIIEFHKLRQVRGVLGVKLNMDVIIRKYKNYSDVYNGFEKQPLIMIKSNMLFDYSTRTKTEYEKALFAMYAGIRSIIGNKAFAETTGSLIKCRMFGAKNSEQLNSILKNKKVMAAYKKYTTSYYYKKMLKELVARGFLKSEIGYNRRTYISCKLSMNELEDAIVDHIQQKSLKSKIEQVEDSRSKSVNSIKRRLNN